MNIRGMMKHPAVQKFLEVADEASKAATDAWNNLVADKARLDWLDDHSEDLQAIRDRWHQGLSSTAREAIDHFMRVRRENGSKD